ncbi:hypothetical protein M9434_003657 [Picochlorum sp. BPE23]|nr:hypothetical protein M9434_003657 [Picochlorum sp. BPE23]
MDQIVERMFCMSDTDGDGCLSEKEFVELVRVVNPESNLEQEHVDLIVEQVWNEFGVKGGLRMEDLKKIYQSGVADVKRDYDLMIKAYRGRKSEEEMCVQELAVFVPQRTGDSGDVTKALEVALRKAVPDGVSVDVGEKSSVYPGMCFGVSCVFAKDAVKADEMEYFKAVLGVEPEQAFSESDFGEDVSVLFAEREAVVREGEGKRESCVSDVMVASHMMGYADCSTFAFALQMPPESNMDVNDMMASLQKVLPRGAAAMVTKDDCLAVDGKHRHLTIACRVPTEKGRIANDLVKSLKNNPHIVFPGVGDVDVIAVQDPERRDSKLMYTLSFTEKGMGGKALFDQGMVVAQDLEPLLPPGSSVHVYESDDCRSTVSLVVNIPKEYGVKEVDSYKDAPRQLHQWCSVANKVASVVVSDGCSAYKCSTLNAFGVPQKDEINISTKDEEIPGPYSPFLERLYGSTTSPKIPEHEGPLRLDDSDDDMLEGIMSPPRDSLIAGYQRRSPSTSGSSGLVEALNDVHIDAAEGPDPRSAELSPDKDAGNMSTVISVHAFPSATHDDKDTAVEEKKPKGGGWKNLLKSLSPKKKSRRKGATGEAGDREDEARHVQKPAPQDLRPGSPAKQQAAPLSKEEVEERERSRMMAIMEANIKQIVDQAECIIHSNPKDLAHSLEEVQKSASLLPAWACHTANLEIGDLLMQCARFKEAQPFLRDATLACPEDPLAYFRLGNTYFALNEYETAAKAYFEAYKRCEDSDPLLVKIHINMGISLESLDNLEAAEREYTKAARKEDRHPRVHKLLGSVRYALGDYDGAIEALEHSLKILPDFADAWADLGCVRITTGNKEEATRCFNMALASDERHIEAHFNLANILRERSLPEEAIKHYDAVLDQEPDHTRSLLGKAVALCMLPDSRGDGGHRRQAAACLRKCLELCSEDDMIAIEVEKLYQLVRANGQPRDLENQLSAIQDAVDGTPQQSLPEIPHSPPQEVPHSDSKDDAYAPDESQPNTHISHNESDTVSVATSRSGKTSMKMSRTVSMASIQSGMFLTDRSYDRLCRWTPPSRILKQDMSADVISAIEASGSSVDQILCTLDVPLLQSLQPLTALTLDALRHEVQVSNSKIRSPSKSGKQTRKIHQAEILDTLQRLIQPRSPPHLVEAALKALHKRILPLLDADGSGYLNFGTIMGILALLVDAPPRERLETAYRFIMSRSSGSVTGETPATRADIIEFISSLKVAFELKHDWKLLQKQDQIPLSSAFVMYEKFSADMHKFFSTFDILPLLCNPLQ